jgi:hypothetical protein
VFYKFSLYGRVMRVMQANVYMATTGLICLTLQLSIETLRISTSTVSCFYFSLGIEWRPNYRRHTSTQK